jgi:hypothetical protein
LWTVFIDYLFILFVVYEYIFCFFISFYEDDEPHCWMIGCSFVVFIFGCFLILLISVYFQSQFYYSKLAFNLSSFCLNEKASGNVYEGYYLVYFYFFFGAIAFVVLGFVLVVGLFCNLYCAKSCWRASNIVCFLI